MKTAKRPGDLAAAGLTGNVRGTGKEGEHFEMSIPEN